MLENLFIRYGLFSVFFQNILPTFYSKVNIGSEFTTKISQAVGAGSNLCRALNFYDLTDFFWNLQWFPWHSV